MTDFSAEDFDFMRQAIDQARLAEADGEVPIGAVVVFDGKVIGRGYNRKNSGRSALYHAEILAIEDASKNSIGDWRLDECSLYVTLEPCLMCAGAIIHARVRNVIFGAKEPKFGGVVSLAHTFDIEGLNHSINYKGGIFEEEIQTMMKDFFRKIRQSKKS